MSDNEIKFFGEKETGMKVPDGYFADFSNRMETLIDEVSHEEAPKVSLWTTVKPWIYLAAMFVSFVVVFKVFIGPESAEERSMLAAQAEEQALVEETIYASVSDYDVYEYMYADAE